MGSLQDMDIMIYSWTKFIGGSIHEINVHFLHWIFEPLKAD